MKIKNRALVVVSIALLFAAAAAWSAARRAKGTDPIRLRNGQIYSVDRGYNEAGY